MLCLSASEIVLLGTKIALDLAKDKTAEEIAVVRALLSQISATLSTYVSQNRLIEDMCKKK